MRAPMLWWLVAMAVWTLVADAAALLFGAAARVAQCEQQAGSLPPTISASSR